MNCPVCDNPFIIVERNNIEVDYCMFCHGFWLDFGELELLNEILQTNSEFVSPFKHPQVKTNEKAYKCPCCSASLKKVKIKDIVIDVCPNEHGIWFDKGELSAILSNSSVEGQEKIINFLGEMFKQK